MAIKSAISNISNFSSGSGIKTTSSNPVSDDVEPLSQKLSNTSLDQGVTGDGTGSTDGTDASDGSGGNGQVDDASDGKTDGSDSANSRIKTTTSRDTAAEQAKKNRDDAAKKNQEEGKPGAQSPVTDPDDPSNAPNDRGDPNNPNSRLLDAELGRGAGAGGAAGAGLGALGGLLSGLPSLFGGGSGGGSGGGCGSCGGGGSGHHGQSTYGNIASRNGIEGQYEKGFNSEAELNADASKFLTALTREDSNGIFAQNLQKVNENQDYKLHESMLNLKHAATNLIQGQSDLSLEGLRNNSPDAYNQFVEAFKDTASILKTHEYRDLDRSHITPADLLTNPDATALKSNNIRSDEGSIFDGIDLSQSSEVISAEMAPSFDIDFNDSDELKNEADEIEASDDDQDVEEEQEIIAEAEEESAEE